MVDYFVFVVVFFLILIIYYNYRTAKLSDPFELFM